MAEGALLPLARNVLELLFVVQASNLPFVDKTEIENLSDAVSKIQAVILDAERRSSHDHQIRDWLSKLKDVLFDADDLLDDLSTEVLRHILMPGNEMTEKVRLLFSNSNPLSFSLKEMGHELKAIRKRLTVVEIDMHAFDFSQSSTEPQVMIRDMGTYSFVLEDEVIGRENDKKEIIERLFDDSVVDNISIIPIVGLGGLGKTTLAQLVYNDEIVKRHFELRIWICVSDTFNFLERIVKKILQQLTWWEHKESLEILQIMIREKLNGKKYLIVLDDLWNEDKNIWCRLRDMFKGGARGSRIIVTTSSERVARITGATSWHDLGGLPEEKAWSLFVKMAFEQGQLPQNRAFENMGKEIVKNCHGVPLSIRLMASLLRTKASENEWQSKNNELSKIAQEMYTGIFPLLKLSYDDLPSHLKQCFAYCRLFPKDYKIHIETLINLWAAQGFIKLSNSKQRFEDVGREYFMELLLRSFFQDAEKDELGNIVCCKMINLMHDLASHMAGTECTMLASGTKIIGDKVRHLSFDPEDLSSHPKDSSKQLPILMVKGKRIRTVLAVSVGINLGELTCDAHISNLNYLRTLDLSNLKLPELPGSIGELKHLRYLDLSKNSHIEILPNSITELMNLQTLLLNDCDKLKELPQGIKKLVNLRHLDITCCFKLTHMPLGLGYLTSLEILPMFVVRQEGVKVSSFGKYKKNQASGGLSELMELSNLGGSLLIQYLGHGKDDILECEATYMNKKQHLQGLELSWEKNLEQDGEIECYDEESLEVLQPHPNLKTLDLSYYMGMKIPSWVSSLTNLVNLTLYENMRLRHLPPLNHLPFLKFVTLIGIEALEYISKDRFSEVFSSSSSKTTFFPSLSSLRIVKCPNLKGWWMNSDDDVNEPDHLLLPSFPRLFELWIVKCPNLTSMPLFPHLKESLELCDSSLKVLQQTMEMEATTSTSFSHNFPLSQLEALSLKEIFDLDSLPDEWLQNLDSLRTLYITNCLGLKSLPWIGNLTSLQRLFINECPNLTSLPIRDLKSLQHLAITGCPVLQQRYRRYIGEDWPNIAHVPHLDIERNQQEIVSSELDSVCLIQKDLSTQNLPYFAAQVLSSPVIKKSQEISETEESEEETGADIETTLKEEGITSEKDESNEEDPFPSLFSEDKSSLPLTQVPVECSLPMSQTPSSRNEADVLTNTWSNQDGVQDLSFESIEVSEISELKDLPSRVHSLKIEECDDLEFIPKGVMSSELSLQDLYIINCCSLKSFPEDHPPTALEILYIRNCKKLNFPLTTEKKTHKDALLKYLCIGSSCDSLKFLSLDLFPNLKSLSIWECANLESLSMPVQKNLTSLEALEIRDCPNLVSFIGGGLCTPNMMSIWLSNCMKLKKLPEMHTLGSLQSVFINNCPELVSLSEKGLPSRLSLLSITFCNKLKLKDEWGLDGLEYLRRLEIEGGCVDMESFPEKFLSSNLSSLRISGLLNLKNLDKGFQKLTTLQRLEISCCPNLRSLPEDGFPSSLSFLCIKKCSLLTSKFRNKKGKDWSKIDHISCIEIDEEVIS